MGGHKEEIGSAGKAIITFSRGWQTLVATREDTWYLHVLPSHQDPVVLRAASEPKAITLLRTGRPLSSKLQGNELNIAIPADLRTDMDDVIAIQWHVGFSRMP